MIAVVAIAHDAGIRLSSSATRRRIMSQYPGSRSMLIDYIP